MNDTDNTNENAEAIVTEAIVQAENGGSVKMRARPTTKSANYHEVPSGTNVLVLEPGEEWSKIQWGSRTGYMMSKFLVSANPDDATIKVSAQSLENVYKILETALGQIIVSKGDIEKAYDIIGDMLGLRG